MKVLQINAVYEKGSTGRIVSEFHNELQKRGIESYVAVSQMYCNDKSCYKIGSKIDCKLHALFARITGLQGYFSTMSTNKLIKYIDNIKPNIIQLHNLHGNFINYKKLIRYIAKNDIPTVITLHDCFFYTGKCMHYTLQNCYKWKEGCSNCPKLKDDIPSWFFDRTAKMWADKKMLFKSIPRLAVIGVSDWITEQARQSLLSEATIIERVYNWIDLSVFTSTDSSQIIDLREKLKLNNKFVILGVASGWSNKKGLDTFLKLSEILNEDEVIVLVGNMPEIKLPKNVISINATDEVQELVNLYSMADVFLQLSLEETFGKVTAEALACGTPVITVDSTANAELVSPDCGIVLKNNDTIAVKNAVEKIKSNGKSYYTASCRKFTEDNFEKNKIVSETIKLYIKTIGSGSE